MAGQNADEGVAVAPQPTREDRFSFGLWTVGWRAVDPFGEATRPALDPVETVHRLAELGAYGVSFHDDDLVPFGSDDAQRQRVGTPLPEALAETRRRVPVAPPHPLAPPPVTEG